VPSPLLALLAAPDPGEDLLPWFQRIADRLLRATVLDVAGEAHELCEIEFYLHGEAHPDPFTHGQAIQRTTGRWYFHRSGESYRGGTYKGLDITFGPPDAFGGILIRSLLTPEGRLINGSSLCVEHLLARTGHADVASLAAAVADRDVDAANSPLRLRAVSERATTIYYTARVGLTLKRVAEHPEMLDYIVRPYRALTQPRKIEKGRVHLIIALHQAGERADAIQALTGAPKHTVEQYIQAYERGLQLGSTESLHGRALSSTDLCLLHGALRARAVAHGAS
jgi:hypothetical protein